MTSSGWDKIYSDPQQYTYYDLDKPHEDLTRVKEIFRSNAVNSILDVGCGLGRNLVPLAQDGFKMSGIDASPNAVKRTQESLAKLKLKADLKVTDFQKLPFPTTAFDGVICVQTLNHGYEKDITQGIEEVTRVLKPGGIFFLTVPGRISKGKVRELLVKTAKKVETNTYLPTIGDEVGIPHHIFSQARIKKYLHAFKIIEVWKDARDYYCVIAQKKA